MGPFILALDSQEKIGRKLFNPKGKIHNALQSCESDCPRFKKDCKNQEKDYQFWLDKRREHIGNTQERAHTDQELIAQMKNSKFFNEKEAKRYFNPEFARAKYKWESGAWEQVKIILISCSYRVKILILLIFGSLFFFLIFFGRFVADSFMGICSQMLFPQLTRRKL